MTFLNPTFLNRKSSPSGDAGGIGSILGGLLGGGRT